MIRVVHVSRNFHPYAGGTEQFIASLARSTRALGVDSSVLCTDRHPNGAAPAPEVPVLRIPTWGPERLQTARHVTAEVREVLQGADVLHFHDLRFGLDLPRRAHLPRAVPRVLSTHGLIFHTDEHAWAKKVAWRAWYLPKLRRFDAIVADSAHDYVAVAALPRARVIENAVDVADFLAIADADLCPDGPLVYFGRVAPNKGLDLLLPVLQRDPSLRLVVVGDGDPAYVAELRRAFGDLPVELTGALPRGDVLDRLRTASAIVLPSRTEGFGITLVEAMATGRPVIAATIPSYRALANGTDVQLVDCADPAALVTAIHHARGTPSAQSRSVARATSCSWETRAPEFVALYEALAPGEGLVSGAAADA